MEILWIISLDPCANYLERCVIKLSLYNIILHSVKTLVLIEVSKTH